MTTSQNEITEEEIQRWKDLAKDNDDLTELIHVFPRLLNEFLELRTEVSFLKELFQSMIKSLCDQITKKEKENRLLKEQAKK